MSDVDTQDAILRYLEEIDKSELIEDFMIYVRLGKLTARLKSAIMKNPDVEKALDDICNAQVKAMNQASVLLESKISEGHQKRPTEKRSWMSELRKLFRPRHRKDKVAAAR